MADITRADVKAYLNKLTVLELSELVKELEEEWGVSAAAPVAAVAMPGGGGGEAEAAEEKTEFDVILTEIGGQKIQVIKAVRGITGLGLKEAKALVDNPGQALKEGVSKEEAAQIQEEIEKVGGKVEIK